VGARVGAWWRGRFGRRLLIELALLFSLLTIYRFGRYLGRNQVEVAFDHARQVLSLERGLGIDTERSLQQLMLEHLDVMRFLNRYYAMVHFPATVAFIALVYVRAEELYKRVRLQFISVTFVALVMQIAYPLAPPRMLSGFVDTVAVYGPAIYSRPGVESVANQYAAMPSLHVGWAAAVAAILILASQHRLRWLWLLYPALTLAVVVVTANHYWLDAAVALALLGVDLLVLAPAARPGCAVRDRLAAARS
jgi:hypothetical protein